MIVLVLYLILGYDMTLAFLAVFNFLFPRCGSCLTSSMSGIYRCIPFRYINSEEDGKSESGKVVQVLMISSSSGPGLLFPKVQKQMLSLLAFSLCLETK